MIALDASDLQTCLTGRMDDVTQARRQDFVLGVSIWDCGAGGVLGEVQEGIAPPAVGSGGIHPLKTF
jgi:hypothetical protein